MTWKNHTGLDRKHFSSVFQVQLQPFFVHDNKPATRPWCTSMFRKFLWIFFVRDDKPATRLVNLRIITVLFLCLLSIMVCAQDHIQNEDSIALLQDTIQLSLSLDDDLFGNEEPLQITLAFDIRGFQRTKAEPQDFNATITIETSDSNTVTEEITLRARGESRRRICDFPPISLNLKGLEGPAAGLQNQDKLKLVTHCKQSSVFEGYVLKEFLVYKLYNLVSPYSYKTRLVQINYVDLNRPDKPYTAYGFIIEDTDDMAERNHSVEIENPNLRYEDMITEHMLKVSLFNYMIGNTDWAVSSLHNIKILKSLKLFSPLGIPVPYDFDFSGFVSTAYAAPADALPIKNVTERLYMGICAGEEELNTIIDEFGKLEAGFMEIIDDFEYLSSGLKKQTSSYIESFYKLAERRNILVNSIRYSCEKF